MIEQSSQAVRFAAHFTEDGVSKTGLTVTCKVRGPTGTVLADDVAATEIGDGFYAYTLSGASTGTAGIYLARFRTASDDVDSKDIPAGWCVGLNWVERINLNIDDVADAVWDVEIEDHDTSGSTGEYLAASGSASNPLIAPLPDDPVQGSAAAVLKNLGTGQATVISPVAANGDTTILQGDTYDADIASALDYSQGTANWPSLTDATITFWIDEMDFDGTVVTATGSNKTVRLELSSIESATIPSGSHDFTIVASLAGGAGERTLLSGTFTVIHRG